MPGKHATHNPSSADHWLECGYWYHHKIDAEARGEDYNPDSDASIRGHQLHDAADHALRKILEHDAWSASIVEHEAADAIERLGYGDALSAEDLYQLVIALTGVLNLLDTLEENTETMAIYLESKVALPHEPGSHGTVDITVVTDDALVIIDYKFGAGPVPADAPQFWVYAGARAKTLPAKRRVILGVMQPRLREEVLTHETTWDAVAEFRGHVNHTVRRQVEGAVYPPASIQTCSAYCPFTDRCAGYTSLLTGAAHRVLDARKDEQIEWLVVNRSAISDGLEILAGVVKTQPERFPNWSRKEVENPAQWNPAIEMGEIAHQLRIKGVAEPYTLRSPADILKESPDLSGTVSRLILPRGTHIRLMRPTAAPNLTAEIQTRDIVAVLAQRAADKEAKAAAKAAAKQEEKAAKAADNERADGRPKATKRSK